MAETIRFSLADVVGDEDNGIEDSDEEDDQLALLEQEDESEQLTGRIKELYDELQGTDLATLRIWAAQWRVSLEAATSEMKRMKLEFDSATRARAAAFSMTSALRDEASQLRDEVERCHAENDHLRGLLVQGDAGSADEAAQGHRRMEFDFDGLRHRLAESNQRCAALAKAMSTVIARQYRPSPQRRRLLDELSGVRREADEGDCASPDIAESGSVAAADSPEGRSPRGGGGAHGFATPDAALADSVLAQLAMGDDTPLGAPDPSQSALRDRESSRGTGSRPAPTPGGDAATAGAPPALTPLHAAPATPLPPTPSHARSPSWVRSSGSRATAATEAVLAARVAELEAEAEARAAREAELEAEITLLRATGRGASAAQANSPREATAPSPLARPPGLAVEVGPGTPVSPQPAPGSPRKLLQRHRSRRSVAPPDSPAHSGGTSAAEADATEAPGSDPPPADVSSADPARLRALPAPVLADEVVRLRAWTRELMSDKFRGVAHARAVGDAAAGMACSKFRYTGGSGEAQPRFLVLDMHAGVVWWCKGDRRRERPRTTVPLRDVAGVYFGRRTPVAMAADAARHASWCCFSLRTPARTYDFAAPTGSAAARWVYSVRYAVAVLRGDPDAAPPSISSLLWSRVVHRLRAEAAERGTSFGAVLADRIRAAHGTMSPDGEGGA